MLQTFYFQFYLSSQLFPGSKDPVLQQQEPTALATHPMSALTWEEQLQEHVPVGSESVVWSLSRVEEQPV